jgi:CBS domain containing-hemolysin-like protein
MDVIALLLAFALVGLNAFFVATEFAIVKVRPTRIEELLRKQRPGAQEAQRAIRNVDAYLSATQLGITIASLGLGWIGEPVFARLIEPGLHLIGIDDPVWIHRVALALAFGLITFLHIVAGELAPKSLAILRAEKVALAVALPMRAFYLVFFPAIWLLNKVAIWILHVVGVDAAAAGAESHTEDELKIIVAQARSAGLLSAARSELVRRAMSLPSLTAKRLMVPRAEVVLFDTALSLEENLERARCKRHTLFPLCNRELDDVVGFIDIRDVHWAMQAGTEVDLTSLASPVSYVPELASGERLLGEFRDRHVAMAVVVNEYGAATGILTPADIVTAVMGDFEEHADMRRVSVRAGVFEVEGSAQLSDVGETLHTHIAAREMRTVAGFVIERLGRMPVRGDRVVDGDYVFEVVDVAGPRVRRVQIQREGTRAAAARR